MNARDLYAEFKHALDYLDVGFRGMEKATVCICKDGLVLSCGGRSCCVDIPPTGEASSRDVGQTRGISSPAAQKTLLAKIHTYCNNGGLFNPDAMDHEKVRDLLIEIRDYLAGPPVAHTDSKNAESGT